MNFLRRESEMPINYKQYPPNWKELRKQVLERADNKCEFCGVENYLVGFRNSTGVFYTVEQIEDLLEKTGIDVFEDMPDKKIKQIKIILTIAHLDHDKENHNISIDRLKALCQKCHLNYDKEHHKENRINNRVEKQGLQTLFNL